MPTPTRPVRLPLECDPFDDESCQDWLTVKGEWEGVEGQGEPAPPFAAF